MPKQRKLFFLALLLGCFVWLFDAFVDAHFFGIGSGFLDSLFFNVPAHEIYMRLLSLSCFIVFGLVVSRYSAQNKLARDALKASEMKFRSFAEQSLVGMYLIQGDKLIYANPKFAEIFGYPIETCLNGMPYRKLVHPEDLPMVRDYVRKREGGALKTIQYEFRGVKNNGKIINVEIFGSSFKSNGTMTVSGTMLDITERRQAEDALRQSETFVKATIDNLPVGIAVNSVDPTVTFEYMNDNFARFYRTSKEALTDTDAFWESVYEDPVFREEIKAKVLNDCASGDLERMHWVDVPITRRGRETRYITARNIPIPDKQLMISTVWDVTAQKRTEEKLREQRHFLQKAQEIGQVGSWKLDTSQDALLWSDQTYRIFGLPIGARVSYESFLQRVHPEDRAFVDTSWKAALHGKPYDIEHRLLINGRLKWVREKAELKFDNNGRCTRGTGLVQDITKRKLAKQALKESEENLQQAQKMESIGTLAGGIAHDFNNILYSLMGYTEMMQEDIPPDSPLQANLRGIYTGAMRARDLVQQILVFSRQSDHEMKPLRVQLVIKEVLKLLRSTLPTTIRIKQNLDKDCRLVLADHTQIHQIAMNLVTNAYYAMEDDGGTLTVTLTETELFRQDLKDPNLTPGPYVCLTVADTGKGIARNIVNRIFDPYFTTKAEGKGTGLGLAVVHGIVKSHCGQIDLSTAPGKGTEFNVYLPVLRTEGDVQKVACDLPAPMGNERVLLVDDEKPIAEIVERMLTRLGYATTYRTSSIEALKLFRQNPAAFDLLITDMTMPNMTGDRLAQKVTAMRPGMPIIICTGFSERMSPEAAASQGIRGFLMKPIIKKDLAFEIRKVLEPASETRVDLPAAHVETG
jgi:PAS domain S-box-containing protein